MKRVKSYNQFRESRPIKEEFLGKLWRGITGADAKEIGELTDKIKSEYDSYSDGGKKEFKYHLDTYIKSNYQLFDNITSELYKKVLDGGEWYGDISKFVRPGADRSIDKIKSDLNGILNHLKDKGKEINTKLEKDSIMKKVTDINNKIDKYKQIVNQYKELVNFNQDKLLQEFEYILKSIPGCPWGEAYFSGKNLSSTTCFTNNFSQWDKDKEFIKTDKFNQLVDKFNKRNEVIKETNINKIYEEIDTDLKKFYEDDKLKDYRNKLERKPNGIHNYEFYQKVLDWAKEELAGKTIKQLLRTIIKEKIVVIKNSDSKETKTEGDKLVAGNIVYSGQNFNNLNKENISRFINKEGYKESYSGKAMYVTNNIPYAFYYCHLRFALEGNRVSDTLFPTIYKMTLKPGTEFFYKADTGIDDEESKSALICGISGFHSGNEIVNNQSVEISIFNSDCIENIEAIKPNELITYLESPQLKLDDNKWMRQFTTDQSMIDWYKGLVERIK